MVSAPSRPQGKKATAAKNTTPVASTVKSMDSAPSRPRGKKATVMKDTTPIASTVEPPNLQPSFIHRGAGAHFGFSQFIVPPGTEPDLQALNNPYVAAAREKEALSAGLDLTGHLPTAATTTANQYLAPPVPLRSTLAAHQPDANLDLFQNLEPTLRPVNNERLGQHGPQDSGAESMETSSEGGNGNTDNDDDDEDHTDNEVGWGAVQGHVTEHPGKQINDHHRDIQNEQQVSQKKIYPLNPVLPALFQPTSIFNIHATKVILTQKDVWQMISLVLMILRSRYS